MVGRICFNADIFPLVIARVKTTLNFWLALLEKSVSDLITVAYLPMQVKHCETIHRCFKFMLLRARPKMNNIILRYTNRCLFELKPNVSFCLLIKKHYTIHNA